MNLEQLAELSLRGAPIHVLAWMARHSAPFRGRARIGNWLFSRFGGLNGDLKFKTVEGDRYELPGTSSQGWGPFFSGKYDFEEIQLAKEFVRPKSVTLDIGACFGMYSIPLARIAKERGGYLIAYEPVEGNRAYLARNRSLNGLDENIRIRPVALGRSEGVVHFSVERSGMGNASMGVSLAGSRGLWEAVGRHATMKSLDDEGVLIDLECSFIKIDVEGDEMGVLEGGRELIWRDRPVIMGEFHPVHLRMKGLDADEPLRWAERNAYDAFEICYVRNFRWSERRRVKLSSIGVTDERSGGALLLTPRKFDATVSPL